MKATVELTMEFNSLAREQFEKNNPPKREVKSLLFSGCELKKIEFTDDKFVRIDNDVTVTIFP